MTHRFCEKCRAIHDDLLMCPPQLNAIVKPFVVSNYELALRHKGNSYTIAPSWSIAWVANGWKVYFNAIDANYRFDVGSGSAAEPQDQTFSTFERAWNWVAELTPWQIQMITVESV